MKITKVRAVPFDKLQTTTPGWKISIGARKPHGKTVIIFVRINGLRFVCGDFLVRC